MLHVFFEQDKKFSTIMLFICSKLIVHLINVFLIYCESNIN
jgi:hypothetical protein